MVFYYILSFYNFTDNNNSIYIKLFFNKTVYTYMTFYRTVYENLILYK